MELSLIDQERICHQFDYLCKLVFRGERCNYIKSILRRAEKEVSFSDMPEYEVDKLQTTDEYPSDNANYSVMGFTIEVRDEQLAAAIDELSPLKRDIVLLYFFMDMNCAVIARLMDKSRYTISYHRRNALVLLKKSMETRGRSS